MGGFENELGDAVRVGLAPASKLEAQQQPDDAGDDRRREARRALPCRAAARHRAKDVRARRQHALRPIRQAPVAHVHRGAVRVHRSDGEHRGRRSRHVNAFAAVVADRGDDQHVLVGAILDCAREQRVRLARGGELAGADVDDVGAGLDRLQHRAGDVELGAGRELPSSAKIGAIKPAQPGATPRTGPSCWPKMMLATCVPWLEAVPPPHAGSAVVGRCARCAPRKQRCSSSTGPSRTAMQIPGSPRVCAQSSSRSRISAAPRMDARSFCPLRLSSYAYSRASHKTGKRKILKCGGFRWLTHGLPKTGMAARMSRIDSLRLAKIVPDVSEN